MSPGFPWGINYLPYNFQSTANNGPAGKIFSSLLPSGAAAARQPAAVHRADRQGLRRADVRTGSGLPTNTFATSYEQANPYVYNVREGDNASHGHGWDVSRTARRLARTPRSAACRRDAAQPHPPVRERHHGDPAADGRREVLVGPAGITHADAARSTSSSGCAPSSGFVHVGDGELGRRLDLLADYYPSGEEIFQTGAGSNGGSTRTGRDRLIKETTSATRASRLTRTTSRRTCRSSGSPNPRSSSPRSRRTCRARRR